MNYELICKLLTSKMCRSLQRAALCGIIYKITKLRRRKIRMNFILLAGFAALIAIMILVTPKDPTRRATYSVGTESGLVGESQGEVIGAYDGLVISEVMSSNATAVTDENGKYADWIEIWNSTDHIINLEHLGLSDRADRISFLFPNISLEADGRVVVFCDNTNQIDVNRPLHAKSTVRRFTCTIRTLT